MTKFVCSSCGYTSVSWYGKCPQCKEWNTLKEFKELGKGRGRRGEFKEASFAPLTSVQAASHERGETGLHEFDRVIGGGFVKGEVMLIGGEPGVGKSTLLFKILEQSPALYISGEESGQQIKQRADRLAVDLSKLHVSSDIEIAGIIQALQNSEVPFDIVVIDSIQTMFSAHIDSPMGSVAHIKEVTSRLVEYAKRSGKVVIIVGHVTKEGDIAGPKTLEHLVDCVLYLEGDKLSRFRILRAHKNRFGPTDEVGVFSMTEKGLAEVEEPSELIESTTAQEPGRALIVSVEGSRALFYEIQSLVVPTLLTIPRRVVSGVDYNRVQLLLAVMRKYMGLKLDAYDIYVSVVGGLTAKTPAADLGIVVSILSSIEGKALQDKAACIGEIGLLGEIRSVFGQEKVLKDVKRFGLRTIYSSKDFSSVRQLKMLLFKTSEYVEKA